MRILFTAFLVLLVVFLYGCTAPVEPPPVINVDGTTLAPEAASVINEQTNSTSPDNPQSWHLLGNLYHAHGLEYAAIQCYEYENSLKGSGQNEHYLLGVAYASLGEYENAIQSVSQINDYLPAIWKQGYWYLDLGDFIQAEKYFQLAIAKDRRASAAIIGLARVYIASGNPLQAITLLEDVQNKGGDHPYVNYLLGTAHQRAGHKELAKGFLQMPITSPPRWEDPLTQKMRALQRGYAASLERATAKMDDGNTQGALSDLLELVKRYPRDAVVNANLASVYLQLQNPEKAIDILSQSLRWSPNHASSLLTMAMALLQTGNLDQAEAYATKAIELQPSLTSAYTLCSRIALSKRDLLSAEKYLTQAVSIGNIDAQTRELLAMVYLDLGKTRQAKKQFELVLLSSPDRTPSISGLAIAYAKLGDTQKAAQIIAEARKITPNDPALARALQTVLQIGNNQ